MKPDHRSLWKKYAFYKLFKLRKRSIFTPSDRLRLRYVVLNTLVLLAIFVHLFSHHSDASFVPDMKPPADDITFSQYEKPRLEQEISFSGSAIEPAEDKASVPQKQLEQKEANRPLWMKAAPAQEPNFQKDSDLSEEEIPPQGQLALAIEPERTTPELQPFPPEAKPLHKTIQKNLKIGKGDTLSAILEDSGMARGEVFRFVKAISAHYNPRSIKPGQRIDVDFVQNPQKGKPVFERAVIYISPIKTLTVTKGEQDDFITALKEEALQTKVNAISTKVETSLYGSALRAGIPQSIVAEIIRLYSWSFDFQRDIRQGDKIEVFYETKENQDGTYKEFGHILYANLAVGGTDQPIYRFKMKDGLVDYFQPDGRSIRKTLMRTPIDGARISSGFGMRRHPILGYNKMHKGVDFAAPTGTPIYAAGDGVVDRIGRNGGYGNYIRIKHNAKLHTAYAHLHKYKRGLKKGSRVRQGDVIGYVGSTGRSTGPHLHYEVIVNGQQKNPRSVNVPTGEALKGTAFARFQSKMGDVEKDYQDRLDGIKVAEKKEETYQPVLLGEGLLPDP